MTSHEILEIPLASIEVGNDRARDLEPAWAEALASLIGAQGLMQPIIVRTIEGEFRKYRLVAGLHRIEAFRLNGCETIPAFLSSAASDDEARLEEVMENLGRYELIALDRCRHLYELKQIHERKYPHAKRGGDRGNQHTGGKSPTWAFGADAPEVFGFAKATAEKIGLSQTRIKEAVKIWTELVPSVRAKLAGSDLARKMTELKALSELPAPRQIKVIDLILSPDQPEVKSVSDALAFLEGGGQPTALERKFRVISDGIKALPDASLDLLLIENEERVLGALKRLGRI